MAKIIAGIPFEVSHKPSIAATLAGQAVPGASVPGLKYSSTMTWRDITLLNYGTTTTSEINWYLEHFNCTRRVTRDGNNYILSASDARPWLWIPTDVPPAPIKKKRRSFSNVQLPPHPDEFSKTVRARFSDLDQDGDGFISVEEINKALNDHKYQGHEHIDCDIPTEVEAQLFRNTTG